MIPLHRQYVARCGKCFAARSLNRPQVLTGSHPFCDHCGTVMTVHTKDPDGAEREVTNADA